MSTTGEALDIYRTHLDLVTHAVWTRQWDIVWQNLAVPTTIRTSDIEVFLATADDLSEAVRELSASLDTMGATAYCRVARGAEFSNPQKSEIEGRHTTYVISGGSYAIDPIESCQTLKLENGVWKGRNLRSAVKNTVLTVINPATTLRLSGNLRDLAQLGTGT